MSASGLISLSKYPGVRGGAPRGAAGSQGLWSVTNVDKAKVVIRKSYGFKTAVMLKITLYHKLGRLPIPTLTHE